MAFGYQVLGFGSAAPVAVELVPYFGGRGIVAGGWDDDGEFEIDTIEYITIASLGNASDFGNLSSTRQNFGPSGLSNGTRGVIGGGGTSVNIMEYITFASLGNVTDFGNLSVARHRVPGLSNGTRGCWCGGNS